MHFPGNLNRLCGHRFCFPDALLQQLELSRLHIVGHLAPRVAIAGKRRRPGITPCVMQTLCSQGTCYRPRRLHKRLLQCNVPFNRVPHLLRVNQTIEFRKLVRRIMGSLLRRRCLEHPWHVREWHPACISHGCKKVSRETAIRLQRHPPQNQVHGLHRASGHSVRVDGARKPAQVTLPKDDHHRSTDGLPQPASFHIFQQLQLASLTCVREPGRPQKGLCCSPCAPVALVLSHVCQDLEHEV
mmetsp:Transcript_152020/g.264938  ORF Transcript_152020/g.264938 Transcript_152020/m.264938 type:complete len:242 (-) Transcript_152020:669-1394(-)